jgi:hypothetical protein
VSMSMRRSTPKGSDKWLCGLDLQKVMQKGCKMKSAFRVAVLVVGIWAISSGQTKQSATRRVILPNVKLIRCMTSDCFQLLQDDPPRPGDIYPEHIDVAFLDRWCPFGLTARYNKAVSFEDLKAALEKRYGKGTVKNWGDAPLMIWDIESDHLFIQLQVAGKRMVQNEPLIAEGAKLIHYDDMSDKICPIR